jgi:hypothetical protein
MWEKNQAYKISNRIVDLDEPPSTESELRGHREVIEPWLSALFQSEHLSLLVGSGFSIGLGAVAGVTPFNMARMSWSLPYADEVDRRATERAARMGRGSPNLEDQFRSILELLGGLRITGDSDLDKWESALSEALARFAEDALRFERGIREKVAPYSIEDEEGRAVRSTLVAFLLSFASRSASRDRLHIFTTNYDRLIELGCDLAGLWKLDRFIGGLTPRFRSSRLEVDLHYNPPGIRGEPRYFEGVVRLTKLHGSIDWFSEGKEIHRRAIPFGCEPELFSALGSPSDALIVYPNQAKDIETSAHPYAEMFRDLSAAVVRPSSTVVTYGYGFGDDHINRVLKDLLSIPSTHLVCISHSDPEDRLRRFVEEAGRSSQISFLVGSHFGDLENLVQWYLPKPAIDQVTWREAELLQKRGIEKMRPSRIVDREATDETTSDEATTSDSGVT